MSDLFNAYVSCFSCCHDKCSVREERVILARDLRYSQPCHGERGMAARAASHIASTIKKQKLSCSASSNFLFSQKL